MLEDTVLYTARRAEAVTIITIIKILSQTSETTNSHVNPSNEREKNHFPLKCYT